MSHFWSGKNNTWVRYIVDFKADFDYLFVKFIFCYLVWKRLYAGTVPANKEYAAGTVPANKKYTAGTVPANKKYAAGTPKKFKF